MNAGTIEKLQEEKPEEGTAVEPWDVHLVEGFFEALNRRDAHELLEVLAEDSIWTVRIGSEVRARYEGRPAILKMLMESLVRSGGTLAMGVEGLTAGDHEILAAVRLRGDRDGRRLDGGYDFTIRVEHGLIVEITEAVHDPESHERFFSNGESGKEKPGGQLRARVTVGGLGPAGFDVASRLVGMLKSDGARLVAGGPAGHELASFVLDVPADWLPAKARTREMVRGSA